MRAEAGRWVLIAAGLVMMICLGAIYTYSIIRVHLERVFEDQGLKVSSTEMQLPFITFLLLFAFTMPLMGKYIEKYGPRRMALLGAVLVGLAWFSASFAESPLSLTLLYGVIGGLGVGVAYNCPITVSARWFPDRRGLAVGLTVFGFGFSAAIVGPLADHLALSLGVRGMLRTIGLVFLVIMLTSALSLRFPPSRWPQIESGSRGRGAAASADLSREEAVRTGAFHALWICYMIGTLVGLMAIGISKQVGFEVAARAGLSGEEASPALTALMVPFALCNGFGRPLFGWLTDKITPRKTAMISFTLTLIASITIFTLQGSLQAYIFTFAVLWLNLGGWLTIAPAATAHFFGTKDYARNYGLIFTAYGVGALIGNLTAGGMRDLLGSYMMVFPVVAALSLTGIIVATALKPPTGAAGNRRDAPGSRMRP